MPFSQSQINDALAARTKAIRELLITFEVAVKAGKELNEMAEAERIQLPLWPFNENEPRALFVALDTFFPMLVQPRPPQIREFYVNTADGIRVEKYLKT